MATTKYWEMHKAVQDAIGRSEKYRETCYHHLDFLIQGFIVYCQIPRENLSLSPLDKDPKEGVKYQIVGASHYDTDGFWHVGVVLNLGPQTALIELCLTESEGRVFVKIGHDGKEREINLNDPSQCDDFYESIVTIVKDFYTRRLQDALERGERVSIGFHS